MPTPTLVPKFQLAFDILAGTLTFTDNSTNRNAYMVGTPRITHVPSGTIIYPGSGWHATTPTWLSPPILTPTFAVSAIALPTSYNGAYLVQYWTKEGNALGDSFEPVLTTRTFMLDYTAPVVGIGMTVLCSTSELTSEDTTDYNIVVGGAQVIPTISRVFTIIPPAGSVYTGTLTWTEAGIINSRTIGGGSTSGTRLWTRVWQTTIVTGLSYVLEAWSATKTDVVLTHTVYGDDNTFAQCDATICALATCYANLLTRWNASLLGNFAYRENKRDTVIMAGCLWDQFIWYERCGTDTESTITSLQTLLAGENCDCTTVDDLVSQVIVPWSALAGSGVTASDFVYHFGATDPSGGLGNNGDVYQQTANGSNYLKGDVFTKYGGAWVYKVNIDGATGAAGTNTKTVETLLNDPTERYTPAGTGQTILSYNFLINNTYFDNANDYMVFEWEGKLALNQNGKLLTIKFAGSDVHTLFCDDLVAVDNERFIARLTVTPMSDVTQHLKAEFIRSGSPGEIIGPVVNRAFSVDLDINQTVALYGTNSVSVGSASDIIGDRTKVTLYHRETDLIPVGVPPLGAGRGLVSQTFIATAGQTAFTVTAFVPNDYYLPLIDNVVQSQLIVTRSGSIFTYAPGLALGQVLTIVN